MSDKKYEIGVLERSEIDKAMAVFDEVMTRLHREHGGHFDHDDQNEVHHNAAITVAASNITAAIVTRR